MTDAVPFGAALLVAGAALLLAVTATRLSARIRVPAPVLFLVAAISAASVVPDLGRLAPETDSRIVTVCVVVILFVGGTQIGRRRFRAAAAPVLVLAVVGTIATAAALAAAAHLLLGLPLPASLLLGAALSPTDPAVVFSVLGDRSIGGRSGTILEGESGFNDPVGIALLAGLLAAFDAGGTGDAGAGAGAVGFAALQFVLQLGVGVAVGVLGGLLLAGVADRIPLPNEALRPIGLLAAAALLFGLATVLSGSGFLAVLVAGIVVGDRVPAKADDRRLLAGAAGLSEIVAFVVLGLAAAWPQLLQPAVVVAALVSTALLVLVIRPVVVGGLLLPVRLTRGEKGFVVAGGLKGAVPLLLALTVLAAHGPDADLVFAVVMLVVLVSVVVQGALVPTVLRIGRVPERTD